MEDKGVQKPGRERRGRDQGGAAFGSDFLEQGGEHERTHFMFGIGAVSLFAVCALERNDQPLELLACLAEMSGRLPAMRSGARAEPLHRADKGRQHCQQVGSCVPVLLLLLLLHEDVVGVARPASSGEEGGLLVDIVVLLCLWGPRSHEPEGRGEGVEAGARLDRGGFRRARRRGTVGESFLGEGDIGGQCLQLVSVLYEMEGARGGTRCLLDQDLLGLDGLDMIVHHLARGRFPGWEMSMHESPLSLLAISSVASEKLKGFSITDQSLEWTCRTRVRLLSTETHFDVMLATIRSTLM